MPYDTVDEILATGKIDPELAEVRQYTRPLRYLVFDIEYQILLPIPCPLQCLVDIARNFSRASFVYIKTIQY